MSGRRRFIVPVTLQIEVYVNASDDDATDTDREEAAEIVTRALGGIVAPVTARLKVLEYEVEYPEECGEEDP